MVLYIRIDSNVSFFFLIRSFVFWKIEIFLENSDQILYAKKRKRIRISEKENHFRELEYHKLRKFFAKNQSK